MRLFPFIFSVLFVFLVYGSDSGGKVQAEESHKAKIAKTAKESKEPVAYSFKLSLEKRIQSNILAMMMSCKKEHGYQENFNSMPIKINLKLERNGNCLNADFFKKVRQKWKNCLEKKLCQMKFQAIPSQLKQNEFELTIHSLDSNY